MRLLQFRRRIVACQRRGNAGADEITEMLLTPVADDLNLER